jgi:hypothetical protein
VDCVPEVALVPDHPPEAEQEVALLEDQVSVEDPPLVTVAGFATSAAVTLGVGPVGVDCPLAADGSSTSPPAPQAESSRASMGASSEVLARGMGLMAR